MEDKLFKAVLYVKAKDIADAVQLMSSAVNSEQCTAFEIVDALLDKGKQVKEEQPLPLKKFNRMDKVVYTDPVTQKKVLGSVLHMQGDLVAVQLIGVEHTTKGQLVDPLFLEYAE